MVLKIAFTAMRGMIKQEIKKLLFSYQGYIKKRSDIDYLKSEITLLIDEIANEYIKEKRL